ncbi:MAG: hypothetical protein RL590_34, partial [Actinomycetota bacterium]
PRRSRPKRTEVDPWMKTRLAMATRTRARIAKVRAGREAVLIGLLVVDISAESRRQMEVSRKACRFRQVVFVLYVATPARWPLGHAGFWP